MNRRNFLSTLALLPGLGWVKPETAQRDIDALLRAGAEPGTLLFDMLRIGWRITGSEYDAVSNRAVVHLRDRATGTMVLVRYVGPPPPLSA